MPALLQLRRRRARPTRPIGIPDRFALPGAGLELTGPGMLRAAGFPPWAGPARLRAKTRTWRIDPMTRTKPLLAAGLIALTALLGACTTTTITPEMSEAPT